MYNHARFFKPFLLVVLFSFSSISCAITLPLGNDIAAKIGVIVQQVGSFFTVSKKGVTTKKVRIAVLALQGPIVDAAEFVKKLYAIRNDKRIDGVMIKIDSGGGRPGSSQILHDEIAACKAIKPVVVIVENMCCSGAYMAAVGADQIIAPEAADIGSIGVVVMLAKKKPKKFKEDGLRGEVDAEVIVSHEDKIIYHPFGPELTDQVRVKIKAELMHSYEIFYQLVAKARGLDPETHVKWAQAQSFSGKQALELKLIDKVGSYTTALQELLRLIKERASIVGEPELVEF